MDPGEEVWRRGKALLGFFYSCRGCSCDPGCGSSASGCVVCAAVACVTLGIVEGMSQVVAVVAVLLATSWYEVNTRQNYQTIRSKCGEWLSQIQTRVVVRLPHYIGQHDDCYCTWRIFSLGLEQPCLSQ